MGPAWYHPDLDISHSEMPRPEYPRPDFQRGTTEGLDWLNLNGVWAFEFDPDDRGERELWYEELPDFSRVIVVPFPWEAHLAWEDGELASNDNWFSKHAYLEPEKVDNNNYRKEARHEIGWYSTQIDLPTHWGEKDALLCFGASDWETKVWVNGQFAGAHTGGYDPFSFNITPFAAPGSTAVIVIRVYDPNDHRAMPGGKQLNWYTRTSGIWQTVYVEPRPRRHLSRIKITPDIDAETATFRITVNGPGTAHTLRITVTGPDSVPIVLTGTTNGTPVVVPIASPLLWSPETPHLYSATVDLLDGTRPQDRVTTYFGMRKVSTGYLPDTQTNYIFLNNRPIYLLGALNQSFNPWGVYTFPSDEAIQEELRRTKAFGFNFLRLHIKVEDPRFLYHADRLGVLLMCDLPNFDDAGYRPEAHARWEALLRATIDRDFNHPSIFSWCCFNETWGLGSRDYKLLTNRQEWVREMYHLTRRLDATRLVEDNSPCLYDHVETQINSWHFYINDYQKAKDHIANVVKETYPGSSFNYVGANVQRDDPLMNSEYGGIGAGSGDKDVSWCFKYLTNELRLHEKICGYIYTELQDIEWEHNGFMNYDRTVKAFGYDYRMINALDVVLLDAPPGQTLPGGTPFEVDVVMSAFSGTTVQSPVLHWRLDGCDRWGVDTFGVDNGKICIPFQPYRVEKVHRLAVTLPTGNHLLTLQVWVEDAFGATVARNFLHLEVCDRALPTVERTQEYVALRYDHCSPTESSWSGGTLIEGDGALGFGSGSFDYTVDLPADLDYQSATSFEVWMELSSGREATPQTEPEQHPSDVLIAVNGLLMSELTLPDAPADLRGVLSYINGTAGRYGELVRLMIDGADLQQLIDTLTDRKLTIRLESPPSAEFPNGVAVYGSRVGRYPVQPCAVFRF